MSDVLSWPMAFRVSFLREVWKILGQQAGGRPIALYGGGRHTGALLPIVAGESGGARPGVIIDDAAGAPGVPKEHRGVPVRQPGQASPEEYALVVVSSDSVEEQLTQRASTWAAGKTRVVRLYGDEFASLMRPHRLRTSGIWGGTLTERNGHLPMAPDEPVLRLARAPDRTGATSLPLPPPELRAGYAPDDDELYLTSGAKDVAAMRSMIQRHVADPGAIRRILDWGCSSGRLMRHWVDLVAGGGEAWGTDICATSLNWASENLSPPFRFFQCTTRPSLPLADSSMDLIYGSSVFTHIRELYDTWLMELRRIVRPGGLVFLTVLDESYWGAACQKPGNGVRKRCTRLDFSKPLEDDCVCHGGAFDPVVFWSTHGVRRRWSFAFDVVAIEPGVVQTQTGVLLRRPNS